MSEIKVKKGDSVYIKAVVDKAPENGQMLYRLITPRGTVVWSGSDEIVTEDNTQDVLGPDKISHSEPGEFNRFLAS